MKHDLTHYLLLNSTYLLTGVIIYFLLSSFKVHIIWYIQPRIYNPSFEKKVFKNYFSEYFQVLFSRQKLYFPTLHYIFTKSQKFKIINDPENKPVNLRLNILKAITDMLKPYLVFAFLWLIVKYLVEKNLHYEPLKVTLGAIQQKLNFINNLSFFQFLQDYQGTVLVIFLILCVLLPVSAIREKEMTKAKKMFTLSLVFLSLLGSISFFGKDIGKFTSGKKEELTGLEANVVAIHGNIYRETAAVIIENDLKEHLEKEIDFYDEEAHRLDSFANSSGINLKNSEATLNLKNKLASYLNEFNNNYTYTRSPNIETVINEIHSRPEAAADFFTTKAAKSNSQAIAPQEEYMQNSSLWSKAEGEAILSSVQENLPQKMTATSPKRSKVKAILELLTDFIVDESAGALFKSLGVPQHKSLKEVITILVTEKYKTGLAKRCLDLIISLRNRKQKIQKRDIPVVNDFSNLSLKKAELVKVKNTDFVIQQQQLAKIEDGEINKKIEQDRLEEERLEKKRMELASRSPWEKIRQDMYNNIYDIDCPNFIDRRLQFKWALEKWNNYLDQTDIVFKSVTQIEDVFWSFAKNSEILVEAFARGIKWYKSEQISSQSPTDALRFYQRSYPSITNYEISKFEDKINLKTACGSK